MINIVHNGGQKHHTDHWRDFKTTTNNIRSPTIAIVHKKSTTIVIVRTKDLKTVIVSLTDDMTIAIVKQKSITIVIHRAKVPGDSTNLEMITAKVDTAVIVIKEGMREKMSTVKRNGTRRIKEMMTTKK